MNVTVQVVTRTDDGQESIREVACVEREDLTPATLGLSLAEGKMVLQAIQEVVVEWQMHAYLKWFLWHGNVFQALKELESVEDDLESMVYETDDATAQKLCKAVQEFSMHIERNGGFIPNDGQRYRHGERISTGFVESTVNSVVRKSMVKKQQLRWRLRGAHILLQLRTRVLNGEWEATFCQ